MAKSKKRRRIKWIVFLVLLLCGLGFGAYKFFRKPVEIIDVQVEPVVRRDLTETVMASGKIHPITKAMISPEVAGEIIALDTPQNLVDNLLTAGFKKQVEVRQADLEDVFIHLTGKALRE